MGAKWNAAVPTSLFNDDRELGVVDVADAGEEVMLHLEVEATKQPAQQGIGAAEVHGGGQLVIRPGTHGGGVGVDAGELHFLDAVGQLKDDTNDDAMHHRRHQVAADHRAEGMELQRHQEGQGDEDQLASQEHKPVISAQRRQGTAAAVPAGEIDKIIEELPLDREHPVEGPEVQMLPAMPPAMGLMGGQTTD